jgi:NAD(P)-dependent dehydrogenase (short-subunit alcohol dehydrogenase family)
MTSVLITGCSTGIGRATAKRLAAGDRIVYATARRVETLAELEAAGCRTLALDVTDEASMQAAVEAVEGGVGVLINNAGYSQSGALETLPMDSVRRQFETNVFGLLRMCQLVLPGMRRQGYGKIVNVSSMGGKLTFPGAGYYHATKHAVEALSDALRFEVQGFGVKVSVIEPGLIKTDFAETAIGSMDGPDGDNPYVGFDQAVARATAENYERGPISRLGGGPEAVAEAIERAISARTPRSRYAVTPSAHLFMRLRRLLPDKAWDALLRTTYPRPGR